MLQVLRSTRRILKLLLLLGLSTACVLIAFTGEQSDFPLPSAPRWLLDGMDSQCSPKHNISFLKTHKCASSTLQNLLLRYGEKHELLFALPQGNYFGGGSRSLQPAMLTADLHNHLGFNIYAVHSKWDLPRMRSMMPPGAVFFTIVREPSQLFTSLYSYTSMQQFSKMNLSRYVEVVDADDQQMRKGGYVGYNQMAWDLGLPPRQFSNKTAIDNLIRQADDLFDLVMVAERMPESLVLLRRLLCVPMEDVVVIKSNARKEVVKSGLVLSDATSALLRMRLSADYLVYEHFSNKFDQLVCSYGQQHMDEDLAEYEYVSMKLQLDCGFTQVSGKNVDGVASAHKQLVVGYQSHSSDPVCAAIVRPELKYLDMLRARQRQRVMSTLKNRAASRARSGAASLQHLPPPHLRMPVPLEEDTQAVTPSSDEGVTKDGIKDKRIVGKNKIKKSSTIGQSGIKEKRTDGKNRIKKSSTVGLSGSKIIKVNMDDGKAEIKESKSIVEAWMKANRAAGKTNHKYIGGNMTGRKSSLKG